MQVHLGTGHRGNAVAPSTTLTPSPFLLNRVPRLGQMFQTTSLFGKYQILLCSTGGFCCIFSTKKKRRPFGHYQVSFGKSGAMGLKRNRRVFEREWPPTRRRRRSLIHRILHWPPADKMSGKDRVTETERREFRPFVHKSLPFLSCQHRQTVFEDFGGGKHLGQSAAIVSGSGVLLAIVQLSMDHSLSPRCEFKLILMRCIGLQESLKWFIVMWPLIGA